MIKTYYDFYYNPFDWGLYFSSLIMTLLIMMRQITMNNDNDNIPGTGIIYINLFFNF
jgi:hypothetical protein